MDTITHALSGALVARATAPRRPGPGAPSVRARVLAGTAAAAFPDIDYVVGFVSPILYLETHRGITHSILLLPLWALALAWVFARLARDPNGWSAWFGVCVLGILTHIVGDLVTSFGTMVLAPVSNARFGIGTTFIIDLWFTGIILAGLVASLAWRRSRVPAVAATVLLGGYVGLQALAKTEAEAFGRQYVREHGLAGARVVAQPRPVSPFNWTVFAATAEEIRFAHVNVRRTRMREAAADAGFIRRLDAAYRPLGDAHWERRPRFGATPREEALARSAWNANDLAFFRWFADLPVVDGITGTGTCVYFRDLRFETPGRGAVPFRYGVCRNAPDQRWQLMANADDGAARPPSR